MVGSEFLDHIRTLHIATYVGVEDFYDQFNFLITVGLLLLCTTVVTVKTYFLSPLECTLMAHVEGDNLKHYVSTVCWTEGTYAIKPREYHLIEIGANWEAMEVFRTKYATRMIFYYQWVPFVLGLQCILFYLPRLLWQFVTYNKTGTDLGHLISQASEAAHSDDAKRRTIVQYLVSTIENLLFMHREYRIGKIAQLRRRTFNIFKILVPSKRLGTWLIFMYFFIKILYIVNCVGQLYIMQHFLASPVNGTGFMSLNFGYQVYQDLMNGHDWSNSLVFPRISFCAFTVKGAASIIHQMAQCALPINMINEKIYIFLWFWFVICTFFNAFSILVWLLRLTMLSMRVKFVKRLLKLSSSIETPAKSDVKKFVNEFLRHDGAFLVRMIALNAGDLVCTEVLCGLYEAFSKRHYDVDFRGQAIFQKDRKSASYNIAFPLGVTSTAATRRKVGDQPKQVQPKEPTAPVIVDIGNE